MKAQEQVGREISIFYFFCLNSGVLELKNEARVSFPAQATWVLGAAYFSDMTDAKNFSYNCNNEHDCMAVADNEDCKCCFYVLEQK